MIKRPIFSTRWVLVWLAGVLALMLHQHWSGSQGGNVATAMGRSGPSGQWLADLRTYVAMARYLLDPETDTPTNPVALAGIQPTVPAPKPAMVVRAGTPRLSS